MWWQHEITGEVRPWRCRKLTCVFCAPIEAVLVGKAIRMAKPTSAVMLTQVGERWPDTRHKVNKITKSIRRSFGHDAWSMAYHVERDPGSPGCHIHGWHRGTTVPKDDLQVHASRAGIGIVDIQRVRYGSFSYGMTQVIEAPENADLDGAQQQIDDFLDINGHRLVHTTRGYWVDKNGQTITQRKAKSLVGGFGEDPYWRRVRFGAPVAMVRT